MFVKRDDEGKVVSCRIQYTDQGDGTVLQDSAILPDSEIHPVQQQHGALYTDADVRMRLRLVGGPLKAHPPCVTPNDKSALAAFIAVTISVCKA